jgi:hypothetical protein
VPADERKSRTNAGSPTASWAAALGIGVAGVLGLGVFAARAGTPTLAAFELTAHGDGPATGPAVTGRQGAFQDAPCARAADREPTTNRKERR